MHSSLTNMSLRRKANFLVCRAFVSIFIKASIDAVASEKLHKNSEHIFIFQQMILNTTTARAFQIFNMPPCARASFFINPRKIQ